MNDNVRTFQLFSQACENNKPHILGRLKEYLVEPGQVLEVGSGSGQHAVHFAGHLPHITWQPTDIGDYLGPLGANIRDLAPANVKAPVALDVAAPWPVKETDHLFTANSLHIMSFEHVISFFEGAGQVVTPKGYLFIYGPFRYHGGFTTESNARFNEHLKARDPVSGIRDFEKVDELANMAGFSLVADHDMPANNQFLVFRKVN